MQGWGNLRWGGGANLGFRVRTTVTVTWEWNTVHVVPFIVRHVSILWWSEHNYKPMEQRKQQTVTGWVDHDALLGLFTLHLFKIFYKPTNHMKTTVVTANYATKQMFSSY